MTSDLHMLAASLISFFALITFLAAVLAGDLRLCVVDMDAYPRVEKPLLIDGHGASTKNGNIGSFHIERGELFVQEATSSSSKKAVIRLKDYNGECGEDGPLNFYDVTKTINSRCVPSRGFRAPPWKRWKLTFEHEGSIGDFYSCGGIIYYGKASVPECTKVSIFVKNNCW